jgi:two-component system, cell cycle sensor histidine kinase and response regulator CckA
MINFSKSKHAGESLTSPESFYRRVIENAGGVPFQLIFGSSLGTGTYRHIGDGIKDLLGITPDKFTEKLFNSLVVEVTPLLPDIPLDPTECRQKMIKGNLPSYKADIRIRTITGEDKWINDCSLPIRDEITGTIIGAQGILTDINDRKNIEKETESNISLLRATLESTADGILVVDSSGKITDFNERFAKMWHIPDALLAERNDNKMIMFVLDQLKYPDSFVSKVKELYDNPMADSYDLLEFKDGRYFDRFSHPQKIAGHPNGRVWSFLDITERKNAERALLESEERYRSLFDRMMDGVYRSTHGGKFVDVNMAMVNMFGFSSKEEMLQVDIKKDLYFAPSERDSLFLDTGQEKIEVFRMRRKNGSEIWVEDHGQYVHDAQGNVIFHEGILRDVTDRLRNEALQNAIFQISQGSDKATTLDDLFGTVHQIINTVMPAKNFFIALYDEEHNMLSFPYYVDEIDPPSPPAKLGKGLTEYVLRTGKPLLCDEATDLQLRKSGEVELIGVPSPIWLGVPLIIMNKPIGVMVVQHYTDPNAYTMQDLQMLEYVSSQIAKAIDSKRAEEKLRRSEEQFRLISENVADLIAVLDLDGKRVYSSPSYKNILGDPQSLRGSDSFHEIHPEDRERIKQIFQDTIRTGIGHRAEYRFVQNDGGIRHIESQSSVIKDKEGMISQVLVVSRDVTDKKKLEQQFLRSQRMESIGTLAGGIAHDLNNVLAPIILAIDTLRRTVSTPTSQTILSSIESSAQRGAEIVKQVLAFARGIDGERHVLQMKHIIAEIVRIIKETFPRSIDIWTEIPKDLWTVSADPTQVHQVILNVCVNARDAMPEGGKLTISAKNIIVDDKYSRMYGEAINGPFVMLTISDTGIGISPKILDKIFEPFFTTKEIGKGTGLGLSTVHAIVKSHGGFIQVETEINQGTKFMIYFPAEINDGGNAIDPTYTTSPQGHGELILVVDDEAPIREITKTTLEANGYNVITADEGTEAISLYAQKKDTVKAVITDIMMPVMDGTVLIRALLKMNPNIKIIVASGLITDEIKKLEPQVKIFLPKPFTTDTLLSAVQEVLRK